KFYCEALGSALISNPSNLTELGLSNNFLWDSGFHHLCSFLESPSCILQTLRLNRCSLSKISGEVLGSALKSNPSNLRELDLSENNLQDAGFGQLRGFLESPNCRLHTLRLENCSLTEISCEVLGSALQSNPSNLIELDLSRNNLKDSVLPLCGFLESPNCRLQTLRSVNMVNSLKGSFYGGGTSCENLASSLKSSPHTLTELDLSNNDLQDLGFYNLCSFLESSYNRLKTLRLVLLVEAHTDTGSIFSSYATCGSLGLLKVHSSIELLTLVRWFSLVQKKIGKKTLTLLRDCSLSKDSCTALVSVLKTNTSYLKELDLRGNNYLQDSDVQQLQDLVKVPYIKLQTLRSQRCRFSCELTCFVCGSL
uniref:NACHT LRR and PYD domain-containing protein n=1 Tax=Oryzias melastigma TaxID=30732 RepID=A0A3B3C9U7_ORYME